MTGIPNGRLGTMLLVGTETVLFSSFIGAYIILRAAATPWPPLGVPLLNWQLSSVNTAVLVVSTILAYRKRIGGAFLMGLLFLFLQGVEFHRLYARGLTLKTGPYGALFYTLISCHGLHVLGGLAIFAMVLAKARRGISPVVVQEWTANAELYWHFVTGIWLVLFTVLYLL